jgi:membrane protein YqaA with SNARE-associated domain
MRWLGPLGGPGLILLGIADNSVVPMPGSMDVATIWLAAAERRWWPYYAAMATLGALLGGYITYGLARKGGKEALEHRLSQKKAAGLCAHFERWGFWAVTVPAMLPPPFPIVPFLLAAGALQYSRKRFIGALAIGRGIRFTLLAGLGARYGRHIAGFFSRYYQPALAVLVALALLGAVLALVEYRRLRKRTGQRDVSQATDPRAA